MFASGKRFEAAMGEDGMKEVGGSVAVCVESEQSNLFEIDPKMSYPPDAFVKAEPDLLEAKTIVHDGLGDERQLAARLPEGFPSRMLHREQWPEKAAVRLPGIPARRGRPRALDLPHQHNPTKVIRIVRG